MSAEIMNANKPTAESMILEIMEAAESLVQCLTKVAIVDTCNGVPMAIRAGKDISEMFTRMADGMLKLPIPTAGLAASTRTGSAMPDPACKTVSRGEFEKLTPEQRTAFCLAGGKINA